MGNFDHHPCFLISGMVVIRDFLTLRGLALSAEKTQIRHIHQGFDFLGQSIRKYARGKLLVSIEKERKSVLIYIR